MFDIQTTVKRRIEILGLCIDNDEPVRAVDLGMLYGRDELAIKRDMQDLRAMGIGIHSTKKGGVGLEQPLPPQTLKMLISQYIGLCTAGTSSDKATAVLVKKHRQRALKNVVLLQRSIEGRTAVLVDYEKTADTVERGKEIWPLQIFQSEGQWRVLGVNDGTLKQYILTKLLALKPTSRKFKAVPREQIEEMFRHSFRSWVGPDRFVVKIRLSPVWADRIKPRQMMETESITDHEDGSVDFETTVNNLSEVASWVVSRGEGVVVLEPPELQAMVINTARGALRNYGG
jgi:predicted DNA-binding transcriptional regulator YafY